MSHRHSSKKNDGVSTMLLFASALSGMATAYFLTKHFCCRDSKQELKSNEHIRFLLSGKVQGVKMRRYIEAAARYFSVKGFCINTSESAVYGEAAGSKDKIALFSAWVRGDLHAVYTNIKPTPIGSAYPALAEVERVLVCSMDISEQKYPLKSVFTMVRDERKALEIQDQRLKPARWEKATTSRWPPKKMMKSSTSQNHKNNSRSVTASGSEVYESNTAVQEYLAFHFQSPIANDKDCYFAFYGDDILPKEMLQNSLLDFTGQCAKICMNLFKDFADEKQVTNEIAADSCNIRALDVGCAVGAATFELSKLFTEVVGLDFSSAFVNAAKRVRATGQVQYKRRVEGDIFEEVSLKLPSSVNLDRCKFMVGDACALDCATLGRFHCILGANLLCRLPRPKDFLNALDQLLSPNGFVVLLSPYSWLTEYTDKNRWLGGFTADQETIMSSTTLVREMKERGFILKSEKNIPFIIREHARKYQLGVSHCTIFQRVEDNEF